MSTLHAGFPDLEGDHIEKMMDMNYITGSDCVWKEAPTMAVLMAVEVLKLTQLPEQLRAMAKTTIYLYGNWQSKELAIATPIRAEMYQRNYGELWRDYYREDGF
ncbi:MAG TPA: hypothetical protein VH593_15210 [Ktedonobacteraceae bacterium]|jgi:hypothetical protein